MPETGLRTLIYFNTNPSPKAKINHQPKTQSNTKPLATICGRDFTARF